VELSIVRHPYFTWHIHNPYVTNAMWSLCVRAKVRIPGSYFVTLGAHSWHSESLYLVFYLRPAWDRIQVLTTWEILTFSTTFTSLQRKTPLNMSEKAVSVVSLKALQPIAKTTYTIDDTAAKALTRKILWKLDTRYFSNHEFHQVPAANDFLQRTPAHYHLISLQLL
jgi:hypothetical protein